MASRYFPCAHRDVYKRQILDAEQAIASGKPADTQVLAKIIEVIEMQENIEFTKKYYSEEAQAKLAGKRKEWKPEMQAEVTRAWTELFRDVEASLDEDPKSEKAQALAARWKKLVEGFTGGDPEVSRGLGTVSYTHLDVYKRQHMAILLRGRLTTMRRLGVCPRYRMPASRPECANGVPWEAA